MMAPRNEDRRRINNSTNSADVVVGSGSRFSDLGGETKHPDDDTTTRGTHYTSCLI